MGRPLGLDSAEELRDPPREHSLRLRLWRLRLKAPSAGRSYRTRPCEPPRAGDPMALAGGYSYSVVVCDALHQHGKGTPLQVAVHGWTDFGQVAAVAMRRSLGD
jgi:hypothetical protein